jgi:hypothetical protein
MILQKANLPKYMLSMLKELLGSSQLIIYGVIEDGNGNSTKKNMDI